MKKSWHLFGGGLSLILGTIFWQTTISAPHEKLTSVSLKLSRENSEANEATNNSFFNKAHAKPSLRSAYIKQLNLADSVISLGLTRIGTPYKTAGISDAGFDCSGFVSFIFNKIGINVPHSSGLLAKTGVAISRKDAQKGDILIFTGTNMNDRTPGHVGVVISNPGEIISFVHSSSNGGVKVSEVETTNYEKRFLEVRRVL